VITLRFSAAIILLSLSAILLSPAFESSPIQEVAAQGYYTYDVTIADWIWVPWYQPYSWRPGSGRYAVTTSILGVPPEHSTTVKIDGNIVGTVPGGSSKDFEVESTESHIFQVESYISGPAGVRYFCREALWTLEKATTKPAYPYYYPYYYPMVYYTINYTMPSVYYYYYPSVYYYPYYYPDTYSKPRLEASHSFSYEPEYMLTVENPYGQSVEKTGWRQKDTIVTLTTPERIEKSSVERSVFKAWDVDGYDMGSGTVTLTMNMPHRATARYQDQYYLEVKSELNQPQGSGWYNRDSEATVSVIPELPMAGFWGSLGGRHVFDSWVGPVPSPNSPAAKVMVDKPSTVTAVWREDYSIAYLLLAAIIGVILVAAFLALTLTKRYLAQPRREGEPPALDVLNLRYTRGEITREEYLKMKKDIKKQS